jgi:hypothetical protein
MKKYIVFGCLFLLFNYVQAQTEISSVHKNINTDFLEIGNFKSSVTSKIAFKNILVIDERFDTSKIGYFRRAKNFYYQLKLKTCWDTILNNYYSNVLDVSSKLELVIVLKHYWKQFSVFSSGYGLDERSMFLYPSPLITEVDIYAKSDSGYLSLFRIEKVYEELYLGKVKQKLIGNFFLPFDSVMNRLSKTDVLALLPKRKLISKESFSNYYGQRKKFSILIDSTINKGVFYTCEDFKNNKPADIAYTIKKGKMTDEVYITQKGEEKVLADFWAVYDGKKLLVRLGLNLFTAVRIKNTFEVFGGGLVTSVGGGQWVSSASIAFQLPYSSKTEVFYQVLQLDLDKGKWY